MRIGLCTFMLLSVVTLSARAQLRLPALPVVPQALPQVVSQTAGSTSSGLQTRLSDVRRDTVQRLLGTHRQTLEADPNGDPIVRGEILALSPSDAALERAGALGLTLVSDQQLDAVESRLVIWRTPRSLSVVKALRLLRAADAAGTYDYNHVYSSTGGATQDTAAGAAPVSAAQVNVAALGVAPGSAHDSRLRLGLVDTGIDASHPVFRESAVQHWGCANQSFPSFHGTAVASLMLGRSGADLYAADVYCGSSTGGAIDVLIGALDWMVAQQVAVINVSLVGPRNVLLEHTVATVVARGYLIVAAVGNDGPAAPPLYPAAYPGVVGVTGVDATRRVLLEAARGPQVMFAAQGANIKAAGKQQDLIEVRGTSFAAPCVAALLAELLRVPDKATAEAAIASLAGRAIDLGAPGRDFTYGFGWVGTIVGEKK